MTNLTINTKNFTIRDWFSSDEADLKEWKGEQAETLLQKYMEDEHILAVQSNVDLKIVGLFSLADLGTEVEDIDNTLNGKQIGFEFVSQDIVESFLPELLGSIVKYYLSHDGYDFLICMPETSGLVIKDAMESVGFSLIDSAKNMYLLQNEIVSTSAFADEKIITEFVVEPYTKTKLKLIGITIFILVLYGLIMLPISLRIYPIQGVVIMTVITLVVVFWFLIRGFVQIRVSNREIIVKNLITRIKRKYTLSDLKKCYVAYDVHQRTKSFRRDTFVKIRFSGSLMSCQLYDTDYSNWDALVDYLDYEGVLSTFHGNLPLFYDWN